MSNPLLSICIPTCVRVKWIEVCIRTCLEQVEALPPGLVEVVVSDNASPDGTWELLQAWAPKHPALRIFRNPENNHCENFNTVVGHARGTYAWLMGDDDAPLPGAVAKVVALLQSDPADLYLLHAVEADLEDHPLGVRRWFDESLPKERWDLRDPAAFRTYLDHAQYMAAAFGFISVLVFRREEWLKGADERQEFSRLGWPHVAAGVQLARRCGDVRIVAEPLVLNRQGNDHGSRIDAFARIMHDLRGWVRVAETCFAEAPELRAAFMEVLRRNHAGSTILSLRQTAKNPAEWGEAERWMARAGFPRREIGAANLGHRLQSRNYPLSPRWGEGALVVADLPRLAGLFRRVMVVALGPLDRFLAAQPILASLRARGLEVKVVCQAGHGALLQAFEVLEVPLEKLYQDAAARVRVAGELAAWGADLLIHADPGRDVVGDLVARECGALVLLAPEGVDRGMTEAECAALDGGFHLLTPPGPTWAEALLAELGWTPGPLGLWPGPAPEAALAALRRAVPEGPWVAVLGDDPARLTDPAIPAASAAAAASGHVLLGLGGSASAPALARLLRPFGDRALALAGAYDLPTTAALLQRCVGYLGGGPAFLAMARAMGLPDLSRGSS